MCYPPAKPTLRVLGLMILTQIYASIVGDCAWAPNGCLITQQNFIDFVYSTLTEIGSADWPR